MSGPTVTWDPDTPPSKEPPTPQTAFSRAQPALANILRLAAEYGGPIQVHMRPHEWATVCTALGIQFTPPVSPHN